MQESRFIRDKLNASMGQIFVAGNQEYRLGAEVGTGAIDVVRKAVD